MAPRQPILIALGVLASTMLAVLGAKIGGLAMAQRLQAQAQEVVARQGGHGVTVRFQTGNGWPTRHAVLDGGKHLNDATRASTARAIAAIPGVGGVRWFNASALVAREQEALRPLHCQDDVAALLRARTIRFEESSAAIDKSSRELVDEVATALRPCLGSIISITGHTDSSGAEPGNLALSQERADAVRDALVQRGIPRDGIRTLGMGSGMPVNGLEPDDPANRRIEFAVIATVPLKPTPVDVPGPM